MLLSSIDPYGFFQGNKASIITLWAIREHGPIVFTELEKILIGEYGAKNSWSHSLGSLIRIVANLQQAGLVEIETGGIASTISLDSTPNELLEKLESITLKVTPRLHTIQTLFDISLTEMAARPEYSIRAAPMFGQPIPKGRHQWAQVFVMMPFRDELKPIYTDHIQATASKLGLTCGRGDDFFSSNAIMLEVWSAIYHCDIGIAACTGRNPNVFYEIGIAHSIGRKCILIAQTIDDIPFDLRHLRTIIYQYTPPGMKKFEGILISTLQTELHIAG